MVDKSLDYIISNNLDGDSVSNKYVDKEKVIKTERLKEEILNELSSIKTMVMKSDNNVKVDAIRYVKIKQTMCRHGTVIETNINDISDFIGKTVNCRFVKSTMFIEIETEYGLLLADIGDYVVKYANGDVTVVEPKVFREVYEEVVDEKE